ncbi:MAG TPA: flagellar biosynthetic protein FliO [Labilithrix sp.]|nr:flagellar biosynthetic protein FliO [Labilithrix sp.]
MRPLLAAGVMALTLGSFSSGALAAEPSHTRPAPVAAPAAAPVAAPAAPPPAAAPVAAPVAETPAPAPEAPAPTPLATRPAKPLSLANAPEHTPFGYKLLAGICVATAAGLWLTKSRRKKKIASIATRIDVVGRTSLGMRSELLVVDVEGTRLLVGMTPSAIQTLAVLDSPVPEASEAAEAEAEEEPAAPVSEPEPAPAPLLQVADRARALLGGTLGGNVGGQTAARRSAPPRPKRATATRPMRMENVAGQAKGLLLALEQPEEDSRPAPRRALPARQKRTGDW